MIYRKQQMEELARLTLHYVCDLDIDQWIHGDKPDLQNSTEDFGIEVVEDACEKGKKAERYALEIWGKAYSEVDQKGLERFYKLGGSISTTADRVTSVSLSEWDNTPEHLVETIKKKIDLLNGKGYKRFNKYGLYVFVNTIPIDKNFCSHIMQIIDKVQEYSKKFSLSYEIIYLDQYYTMCVCNMEKREFFYRDISKVTRDKIYGIIRETAMD